jgi:hypothetical protein
MSANSNRPGWDTLPAHNKDAGQRQPTLPTSRAMDPALGHLGRGMIAIGERLYIPSYPCDKASDR